MKVKHGITVEVQTNDRAEPEAEQVRLFLFEAVRELLLNAIKYAKVDTVHVRMDSRADGEVCVTVADNGVGFDPAQLGTASAIGGTGGFGLFSIKERLNYLGGNMGMEAAPGRGSRFTLIAPARLSQPAEEKAAPIPLFSALASKPSADRIPAESDSKIRVIVADDHPVLRQGLARLLQEEPDIFVVGEAGDGRTAVDLTHKLKPDLVVMDVGMPIVNGLEATRQIRAKCPNVSVIALSMHEEPDMAASMREAGAAAYLTKGGPTERLIAVIRACHLKSISPETDPK
jgi:CheY-like chemotaxis protein/anti-sigma regulatory factor (Ser/Thr protein kinase)